MRRRQGESPVRGESAASETRGSGDERNVETTPPFPLFSGRREGNEDVLKQSATETPRSAGGRRTTQHHRFRCLVRGFRPRIERLWPSFGSLRRPERRSDARTNRRLREESSYSNCWPTRSSSKPAGLRLSWVFENVGEFVDGSDTPTPPFPLFSRRREGSEGTHPPHRFRCLRSRREGRGEKSPLTMGLVDEDGRSKSSLSPFLSEFFLFLRTSHTFSQNTRNFDTDSVNYIKSLYLTFLIV